MTTIEINVPALPANRKIHAIMAKTLENLACLFHDCEDDIQSALTEGVENVTISHSIVLNLGKNKKTDKLSVSIKRGDEITCTIPDPDQPDLFSNENPTVRTVSPAEPAAGVGLIGLPAPVPGIAMIDAEVVDAEVVDAEVVDAEVIDEDNNTATAVLSVDQVWVLGAPDMLNGLYENHELSRDKFPWCGIDGDGEVIAFQKEPINSGMCWKSPNAKSTTAKVVGQIEADGAMELWFWSGEQWERKFTDNQTEEGEEIL